MKIFSSVYKKRLAFFIVFSSIILAQVSAKEKELHSLKLTESKLCNKSYRDKIVENYEMQSTDYEISGDLIAGEQYKNNNGDFIEFFEIKIFSNVFVKYVGCQLKNEFKSWSEVKFITNDKKQFGATMHENAKTIAVPKAASGWYLTAFGIKMYGAYTLWGRTLIRNCYDNLSREKTESKDKQLVKILEEEKIDILNQEARENWNKLYDDVKYAEDYWTKLLKANVQ